MIGMLPEYTNESTQIGHVKDPFISLPPIAWEISIILSLHKVEVSLLFFTK